MHPPTEDHRTAKDLSPEELAEYRRKLDLQFQNRKIDEALLQRAWQTAHQVAAMLYEDFGCNTSRRLWVACRTEMVLKSIRY